MTTNCNDTCDAVHELLLSYSVITNGFVGAFISILFVFHRPFMFPTRMKEMAFQITYFFKLPVS